MTEFKIVTPIATIYTTEFCPSKNKFPTFIEHQFQFRKYNKVIGENEIVLANMGEAVWWNRPQIEDTEEAWGIAADGLPCCNLPISFGKKNTWKSNYNILINKNNLPIGIQLKFNHDLTLEEIRKLKHMSFAVIWNTLKKLNINEKDLCVINNDILLRGKKFIGSECVLSENVYTECIYITLKYLEEKEVFDRLSYGKVSATAHKQITGLIDEYPNITKEEFLQICCEEFRKYLEQFEL